MTHEPSRHLPEEADRGRAAARCHQRGRGAARSRSAMGTRRTLHLWWARRPLAAARAVIFAQLVNDPEDLWRCQNPGIEPNQQVKGHWTKSAQRLFTIIEDLVLWENTTNERAGAGPRRDPAKLAGDVRAEQGPPAGEGTVQPGQAARPSRPVRRRRGDPARSPAARAGSYASDLNPVAVLINKAMIEIPPKFAGKPPVNPDAQRDRDLSTSVEGRAGPGRGRALLRPVDARRGREAHRPPLPAVEITAEMAKERPDLKPLRRQEAHRDRLALGADGEEPEPGVSRTSTCRSPPPSCSPPRRARKPTSSR